ncbi:carboxylate--amine ligase [Guggenheimella bovis]
MNKAVVLGNNYYIGLSITRCLGKMGVHVVNMDYKSRDNYGWNSRYVKETRIVPHYREETEAFVQALIDFAKEQEEPPVLFPGADPYVEVIEANRDKLDPYYLFPKNEIGLVPALMNKDELKKCAEFAEVLIPETLHTTGDYLERVEEEIGFPCLVKPTDSPLFVKTFRKKLFQVENLEELKARVKEANDKGLEVIIQRIIPGFDDHMVTFDAYVNNEGKVTHWLTCQKLRQYPIHFGASVFTRQTYIEELPPIGIKFFEKVGFKGYAEIEFKYDETRNAFYLIEVNVRTTSLNCLVEKAGLNMPYILYRDMIGDPVEPKNITEETELTFRYWFEDRLAIKEYIKAGDLTEEEVKESLKRKIVPAVWDKDDPMPGFSYALHLLRRAFKKVFRKLGGSHA